MLYYFNRTVVRGRENAVSLSEAEDRLLRQGFGRFATAGQIENARRLIIALADRNRWLLCDCLPNQPVMIPVRGAHATLRRQPGAAEHDAEHDAECDFARPPGRQRRINRSLRRCDGNINLGSLRARPPARVGRIEPRRSHDSAARSKLARLLMTLIDRAGLNRLELPMKKWDQKTNKPVWIGRPLGKQLAAIRDAARGIQLLPGIPASRFFKTNPEYFKDLQDSLYQNSNRFGDYIPFGLMLFIANGTDGKYIFPVNNNCPNIPCQNASVKVFGEEPRMVEAGARAPYIALCLVSENAAGNAMEVVRAYLHPCLNRGNLFPVDSNAERTTLRVIEEACERAMGQQQGLSFAVEKPLFSLAPVEDDNDNAETCAFSCIPDFILHCTRNHQQENPLRIIIETMGFENDPNYWARKERTHPEMMRLTGIENLLLHRPLGQNRNQENSNLLKRIAGIVFRYANNT